MRFWWVEGEPPPPHPAWRGGPWPQPLYAAFLPAKTLYRPCLPLLVHDPKDYAPREDGVVCECKSAKTVPPLALTVTSLTGELQNTYPGPRAFSQFLSWEMCVPPHTDGRPPVVRGRFRAMNAGGGTPERMQAPNCQSILELQVCTAQLAARKIWGLAEPSMGGPCLAAAVS